MRSSHFRDRVRLSAAATLGLLTVTASASGVARASTPSIATRGPVVTVTITTDDRTQRLQHAAGVVFQPMSPGPDTVFIDDRDTYQTIQGFGAAWTDSAAYLLHEVASPRARERAMRALFTRDDGGIGLSFMRIPMGASDIARSRYSYDDQPAGRSDPTLADFSIAHDRKDLIPLIRESLALDSRMTLMATPWSPPGWMKSSGSMIGGTLLPRARSAFAQYFVKFLRAYRQAGIPVQYLTLQNEPLYQPQDYPGMSMPAATQLTVLRDDVLPALRAAGLSTRVLLYDHNWDRPDYPDTILSDAAVRASGQVAGIAWHGYGGVPGAQTVLHGKYPQFGEFETESSGGTWVHDQVRTDFEEIIQVLRDYGRSFVKWSLALDQSLGPHDGGCATCAPIVTVNSATGAVSEDIEFATLGQFSRFILPGARRVYSSDARGIESVALIDPDGGHVLVAFNDTDGPDTFQVQWGAQSWRYTLPAYSGATFTWRGRVVGAEAPRADAYHAAASYASTGGRDSGSDISTWGVRDEQSSSPEGGYDLGYAVGGDWAEYPGIDFRTAVSSVSAEVACGNADCGTLEFHLGSPTGTLIARLPVAGTGDWQRWRKVSGRAEAVPGKRDLYIVWQAGKAGADGLANLLSFQFH